MRTGRLRVAALAGAVLALTGCVGGTPLPTLPPTPTTTPIFASEEEALAAAEEAYAAYLEVAAQIASDGGLEPERISPFVTERQLEAELDTAAYYRTNQLRVVGAPELVSLTLQQYNESPGVAEIRVYVCLDVSPTSVLDAGGNDVTPERGERGVLEVGLLGSASQLLIDSSELWPDSSTC